MYDHVGALIAILAALAILAGGAIAELRRQRQVSRSAAAAMRRRPSARDTRDFTSPAAVKYHSDNSVGRN